MHVSKQISSIYRSSEQGSKKERHQTGQSTELAPNYLTFKLIHDQCHRWRQNRHAEETPFKSSSIPSKDSKPITNKTSVKASGAKHPIEVIEHAHFPTLRRLKSPIRGGIGVRTLHLQYDCTQSSGLRNHLIILT